ncbi:energy-coupling factor transporter transmembrane component T family protein [Tianweitania sediminis]|uniref:Energy-coupling factor transporter transmembrane protein EcfT n=1 Tax=Tianweitania sediminis TaxID=1502156 RepID=A0A8J7QZW6_9HYPH|nr:energy-coupling factor transporter transmembrane protein EcfT [Tianweitania sediminis]MBP0437296.1 energy-coupling factor transporter transmembrane protein EcfT [Tianweitania sediminis]
MLNGFYVEGNSLLHRISAEAKLLGLAALGVALFFVSSPLLLGGVLVVAAAFYLHAGLTPGKALRRLMPVLYSLLFLMALNLFFLSAAEVGVLFLRILALLVAAAAVTATTPIDAIITAVNRLLRPLERTGLLRPGDAGLAVGLSLRFVPDILSRYGALAEAHKARGLKVRPLTLLTPLVILTLKQADDVAAAIDARSLRAVAPPPTKSSNKGIRPS